MWKYSISENKWYLIYGTNEKGVDPDYYGAVPKPGAHVGGHYWADNDGHFWMFGGSEHVQGARDGRDYFRSEIWRFNISSLSWTLLWGPINHEGSYEGQVLYPGDRMQGCSWMDTEGNLWLFGGQGWGSKYMAFGELSDMWFARKEYLFYSECDLLNCSANSQCLPDSDDGFMCVCNNGYLDIKGQCISVSQLSTLTLSISIELSGDGAIKINSSATTAALSKLTGIATNTMSLNSREITKRAVSYAVSIVIQTTVESSSSLQIICSSTSG